MLRCLPGGLSYDSCTYSYKVQGLSVTSAVSKGALVQRLHAVQVVLISLSVLPQVAVHKHPFRRALNRICSLSCSCNNCATCMRFSCTLQRSQQPLLLPLCWCRDVLRSSREQLTIQVLHASVQHGSSCTRMACPLVDGDACDCICRSSDSERMGGMNGMAGTRSTCIAALCPAATRPSAAGQRAGQKPSTMFLPTPCLTVSFITPE